MNGNKKRRQLSLATRRELIASGAVRYASATRREKKRILDEFAAVTAYHRKQVLLRTSAGSDLVAWEAAPITAGNPFKGRQYTGEVILLAVRWYLWYPLAYEHVSELLTERGVHVHRSCIWRWVQAYAPELNKRCRPHLKSTNKSYRVDETYIKVKGKVKYLYRAVDSTGQTIDFLLTAKRDAAGAKRFFRRVFSSPANPIPRVINVDKNPAYPAAISALKREAVLPRRVRLRQCKFLNNVVEQGSPSCEKANLAGQGLRSVSQCVANSGGHRNDAHDSERSGTAGNQGQRHRTSAIHIQTLRSRRLTSF
jgi:transposase, IS6 family